MNRIFALTAPLRQASRKLCMPNHQPCISQSNGYKPYLSKVHKELYKRRMAVGPEPVTARSRWRDWDYNSEIYAFGKRLNEDFSDDILKTAFVDDSYVAEEIQKRKDVGIDDDIDLDALSLSVDDNTELAKSGYTIASDYIIAYLGYVFPKLIESGKVELHNYLLSDEILSHVSSNLGTKDLVKCQEYPPTAPTLSKTLYAVIGALSKCQGRERAELFVQDFILTQLHGKDLMELLNITNPMGLLMDLLKKEGRAEPEPRLLWETGSSTVLASYVVGIYSNKQLIGQSPGETLVIAEEMAVRDALRKYFGLMDNAAPLKFGEEGKKLDIRT